MPDTGFMSPDNVVSTSGTFFTNFWINEGGGIIVFFASSGTQTVDGFENDGTLPAGATITGAEVELQNTYVGSGTGTIDIQLSINGGSSFSSSITSPTLTTDSLADYIVGSSTQLWGLDWSGFSDLSQLQLKGLNPSTAVFADHVRLKLHYEVAAAGTGPVRLQSGAKLKILSGKFLIN